MPFTWIDNRKKDEKDKSQINPFVNKYSAGRQFSMAYAESKPTKAAQQYNYGLKSPDQWSAPEYTAYGRLTGDNTVFDNLNTMTDQRGSRFWNPYRGGRSVLPDGCENFFRTNFGYEGRYDQQFCDDLNALFGGSVGFTKTLGVSTPTNRSSVEEWAGYWGTQVQDNLLENNKLNEEWNEGRRILNDYYDQYQKINGRAPSLEEFESAWDRSKYSKIKAIDESLQLGTKLQVLPIGTYYSPDIIPGLYQAKQNGEDINVDRDYFEDAVQYAMNPVQKSKSAQKYIWQNDDLSETTQQDRDNYLKQLYSNGEYEEASAYQYAWWAAQPHDDGISAEPSVLDAAYGYYHDDAWFDRVFDGIGEEYNARLNYDGTMDNPGKSGDYMDQACWQLYNILKDREKTDEVYNGYKETISSIQNFANKHLKDYNADEFESFKKDILRDLDLDNNATLKPYLEKGYDPAKYCRDLHFSNETIGAAIKRAWDGETISPDIDYAAEAEDGYVSPYAYAKPAELPMFYDYRQKKAGEQRMLDRNNAEAAMTDAAQTLSESGALISKGAIPVTNDTFDEILGFGNDSLGTLGKLWKDVFGAKHSDKLGSDFSPAEAAAVDPVLAQIDTPNMPEVLTTDDIAKIMKAKMMSRVGDDNLCLADGIINYALPGNEHLHDIMLERSATDGTKEFNPLTYRNIYLDRVNAGMSGNAAARVAVFAATDINQAVQNIGKRYEGDDVLTAASQRLLNDMAQEEGAKDSYDIYMAVNDDIRGSYAQPGSKADETMQKLLPALLLGSSEAAKPGFRAETNRLTHDIATGAITADDIVEGLNDVNLDIAETNRHEYEGTTVSKAAEDFLRSGGSLQDCFNVYGTIYTREEYEDAFAEAKTIMSEANSSFGSTRAFESLSPALKSMIGYDEIMQASESRGNEIDARIYAENAIINAVDDIANPDKLLHTSPLMHNTTDLIGQLNQIGDGKSEHDINVNLINTRQSWVEKNILKKDGTGFTPAIAAFLGEEQSVAGDFIDLLRAEGKFFSRDEADAMWNAFFSGRASYDDIERLVNERVQAVPGEVVNALNNPDVLEKTYVSLDEGLERMRNEVTMSHDEEADTSAATELATRLVNGASLEAYNEYPGIFDVVDTQWIQDQLDNKGLISDEELISRISGELGKYGFNDVEEVSFTPEQLYNIGLFVNQYKQMGANGFYIAAADADVLKNLYGIDLSDTGFNSGHELLDHIDPDWSKPYNLNPGYTWGALETVGKGMAEGFRAVLKIPTLANRLCNDIASAIKGDTYNPETSTSYRAFKQQEQQTAAMRQNVATRGQTFVEQGVSEVVRNAITSGIGAMIGEAYAVGKLASTTGMHIDNIAAAGEALEQATKLVNRSPFATSVFLNEYDQQRNDGKAVLSACLRGSIGMAIELGTEDLPFEKLYSFRIGGFSIGEHAVNNATSLSGAALNWVGNSAKNMLSEIGEEEASEFLGRIVETGEAVIKGESLGEAFSKSFEGYEQAAKDTALATAFTTMIFSAADLGGITYSYMNQCLSDGRQADAEQLMTAIQADIIAARDTKTDDKGWKPTIIKPEKPAGDYDPATQVPFFGGREGKTNGVTVEQNNTEQGPTPFNAAEQVPFFGAKKSDTNGAVTVAENMAKQSVDKQTDAEDEDAEDDYINENGETVVFESVIVPDEAPATQATVAENKLVEAVKAYTRQASDENARKIGQAATDMMTALSEERAEAAQKAQETTSEPTEENAQEQPEEQQNMTLELSENAQRVRDYVDHAEAAMDNAIIDKGAEMEAEKAVAEDAGLKAREESIQKMQSQLEESEQKIAGMQQQAQIIIGKTQQMLYAAVNSNLDTNSPQVVNTSFQLNQQRDGVQADIGKETEKRDSISREIEESQRQLEAARERVAKEFKEKTAKDLAKRIEKAKERLSKPGAPQKLLGKMDAEAERDMNAIRAEQGGYTVHSQFTDEEDKANRAAIANEQLDRQFDYTFKEKYGIGGTENLDAYTDPANYRQKSVVTERRDSEWRDEAKHRQDRMNENVQEEQRNRMRNDFTTWREENAPINYVSVSPKIAEIIRKGIAGDTSSDLMDSRYLKTPETGDAATVYSYTSNGKTKTREQAGYSLNPEETGVLSLGDFLNDDGTVTGLAYRAIMAADPSFVENPELLKVNATHGGVDAVLNFVTQNNRYLILSTPGQTNYGKLSLDKDRYTMLTRDKGLKAYEREATRTQKVVDQYLERMRSANQAMDQLRTSMNDPNADQTQASLDYKERYQELERANRGYRAAQSEAEKAKTQYLQAQEFVNHYKANAGENREKKTMYIIDKAAIEEAATPLDIYKNAFIKAADRISENAFLSDDGIITLLKADVSEGNSDAEDYIDRTLGNMTHEELGAVLFDHFLQQELQKGYAEQYKGAVQVITEDELKDFIHAHGGYSADGFGGEGFSRFNMPSKYFKHQAWLASEEAILKYVPESMYKGLILEANGNTADFDATRARYNSELQSIVRRYASEKGLSDTDAAFLGDTYGVRSEAPKKIDKNTIVASDDTHFFGVPTKDVDDYNVNQYLRSEDGSYDVTIAKRRLQNELRYIVQLIEDQQTGQTNKKFNSKYDYIGIDYVDDLGNMHKNMIVGEYYTNWKNGSRFLPSYDELMEMANKIVCNFFVDKGMDNRASRVNFVLVPDRDHSIDLRREMESVDYERAQSELAYRRGHTELMDELKHAEETLARITSDPIMLSQAKRVYLHSKYNLAKNELRTALKKLESCTPETFDYYKHMATVLYAKTDLYGDYLNDIDYGTNDWFSSQTELQKPNEGDMSATEKATSAPVTAKEGYEKAKARYEALTDKGNIESTESYYDAEREMLSDIIPDLKKSAEQEEQQPKPKRPDPIARRIAEEIMKTDASDTLSDAIETEAPKPEKPIDSFRGDNAFLSNFYAAPVEIDGITYQNAEAAFQAQKLDDSEERKQFSALDGKTAKRLGRKVKLRADWDTYRDEAMRKVVEAKFEQNPELMGKLTGTGKAELIEGNTWNDTYWGVSNGTGENNLGKILMAVRDRQYSKASTPISDEAKLAALKNLSDTGADIADIRSKAIQEYHNKKMEGMSEDEKIDYVAALARQQAETKDGYTIDPNVDYDKQLGDIMKAQIEREKSEQGRRLRYIAKKAGSYKTTRGVNNAMDMLNEIEKAGHDVTAAREALQKNLDAINTPFQAQKDAVIETESKDNPDIAMNLQFFSDGDAVDVSDTVSDEIGEALELIDAYAEEAAKKTMEGMAAPTPPAPIETGFEGMIDSIKGSNKTYYKQEDVHDLHNRIAEYDAGVKNRTVEINDLAQSIGTAIDELRDAKKEFAVYDQMPGHMFTDKDLDRYNELSNMIKNLEEDIDENKKRKDEAKTERDELKKMRELAAHSMSVNKAAEGILRNQIAATPEEMTGNNKQQTFKDGRRTARGMANAVMKELGKGVYANLTSYTPEQVSKAIGGIIDELEMAFNQNVATAVNNAVKEQKKAATLLDLAKARIDMKKGTIDSDEYHQKHLEAIEAIHSLSRMQGYTEEDYEKDRKAVNAASKTVKNWEEKVDQHFGSTSGIDALRTLYDNQLTVINAGIENAQNLVNMYYKTGSESVYGQLTGANGGHTSIQLLRLATGLVLNGNDSVKFNKTFHPVSLMLDTFPRVVDQYLGKTSGLFNSIYTEPVMRGNGNAARRLRKLKREMKSVHLQTMEQRETLAKVLDSGMTDADIRVNYPKFADELIRARDFHRKVYDTINEEQNVVYSRNGFDPVKHRNNYYPHMRKEDSAIFQVLGINTNVDELPVGLLGNTSETTPGHQFNAYELERKNEGLDGMDLDAERVLLTYAGIAYRTIYQTDNIVRLNDLITYLGGDRSKPKDQQIGGLDYSDTGALQKGKFNTFVRALEVYRDMLAGKKTSKIDRAIEEKTGRKVYAALTGLSKLQGAAKVGGNLNPVFANFIPVYTASALDPISSIKACYQTIVNRISKLTQRGSDGIIEKSNFYASRVLNEKQDKTIFDKITNTLFIPMRATDSFASELVYRTCYNNALRKLGGTGHEQQAAQLADDMCLRIMADKSTGMKGSAYNSAVGNILLQFSQEGVNNLRFLTEDFAAYTGMKNDGILAKASGVAKAIAALLAMFAAGYGMNKFTGRNTAIDPYGAWKKAENGADEDSTTWDKLKTAGTNLFDAINPVENITEGNLLEAPVPKGITDILSAMTDGAKTGLDALFGSKDEEEYEWKWAEDLAKALWGWIPGSTAASRVIDTAKAANRGYATNSKGKITFPFTPNTGNILKAAAFGLTSVDQAQEYVNSGYRAMKDKRAKGTLSIQAATGLSFAESLAMQDKREEADTKQKEASELERWNENSKNAENEAKELRKDVALPDDLIEQGANDLNDSAIQKGIKLWQESGLTTYPTGFSIYNDTERGSYFKNAGKNVSVDETTLEKMNTEYYRNAKHIIEDNDDPETIEKKLTKLKNDIKKEYLGGE